MVPFSCREDGSFSGGDLLMTVPTSGITNPTALWFAADGSCFNLTAGQKSVTVSVPRFAVPTRLVDPLIRLHHGFLLTRGVAFVYPLTRCRFARNDGAAAATNRRLPGGLRLPRCRYFATIRK